MKVRLFEIFTSVEGEGILYGTKTLFVRLAGCPFTCFYCDTKESLPLDSGTEYTIEAANQLIDSNLQNQTYKVNFTGGDPLIQHQAVAELAKHIQNKKIPTYLESSVKSKKITYIKIVVSSKTKLDDFQELVNQIFNIISKESIDGFVIQPTYGISEPSLDLLLNLYDIVFPHYIDVKVVPQLHKFIGAP